VKVKDIHVIVQGELSDEPQALVVPCDMGEHAARFVPLLPHDAHCRALAALPGGLRTGLSHQHHDEHGQCTTGR
jgi:hypothetical protein